MLNVFKVLRGVFQFSADFSTFFKQCTEESQLNFFVLLYNNNKEFNYIYFTMIPKQKISVRPIYDAGKALVDVRNHRKATGSLVTTCY